MKQEKYGFVYIWRDRKYKRYYIGAHWGTEDDGYICSSSWMRNSYKRRPEDFKRKILKSNVRNKKLLLEEEYKWLKQIKDDELGKRYYNLHNHHFNHWSANSDIKSISEKISLAKKGISTGPCSEDKKQKISKANKGRKHTEEAKEKMKSTQFKEGFTPWNKGILFSKERKEQMKHHQFKEGHKPWNKGKSHSEETKEKIRLAGLNKTNNTKKYIIYKPDESIEIIENLKQYCKVNNLSYICMIGVSRKEQKQHKGYKCDLFTS